MYIFVSLVLCVCVSLYIICLAFLYHIYNFFNTLKKGSLSLPEYEACFMELLHYAPLKHRKAQGENFCVSINVNIWAKVRILIPQTLHDAV